MENLIGGFATVFQPATLLYCFIGVLLGTMIGVLPFFGFNIYFYFVEPVFNELILLDAAGNAIFVVLCFLGYRQLSQALDGVDDVRRPEVRLIEVELEQVTPELRARLEAVASSLEDVEQHLSVWVEGDDKVGEVLRLALDAGARVVAVATKKESLENLFVRQAVNS